MKKSQSYVSKENKDDPKHMEYVLEVIGLGVTLDKYRQGTLWNAIEEGSPYETIRDMDPKNYPWTDLDKMNQSGSREGASLENAILDMPRYWGIPAFNAAPRFFKEEYRDHPDKPQAGIVGGTGGMQILVLAGRELSERPDIIISKVFKFFDENPHIPFVVFGTSDSDYIRSHTGSSKRSVSTGYYVPHMPDSSVVFVVARRERVDALRPFVFEDIEEPQLNVDTLNRHGVARRVWLNYLALEKKLSRPLEKNSFSVPMGRQPTGEEWLSNLTEFAKQFDRSHPTKPVSFVSDLLGGKPRISSDWKPMPWFPVPWNTDQLAQFDKLPTLGFLHRPVFVSMADEDGNLIRNTSVREKKLRTAWKEVLNTLPPAERQVGPARVIVATGGKTPQLLEFHALLRKIAEDGGTIFDPSNAKKFIDTDRRLGDTGAATFFMQTAIGILGSYRDGGTSAVFNLRDPKEVSIILTSPPSEEKRKNQQHPIGGDVFQNTTIPLVDPKNYQEPFYQ